MKIKVLIVVILLCIVSMGGFLLYGKGYEKEEGFILSDKATEDDSVPIQTAGPDDKGDKLPSEDNVCCYVCGEVSKPGVYELGSGSRIVDFIDAAGGFSESADVNYLNLALRVSDGDKIYVPSLDETKEKPVLSVGAASSDGLVNINTAGINELMTLPGIGETKAKAIFEYRNAHGNFSSTEGIKKVSGIGDSTYQNIKAYIKI